MSQTSYALETSAAFAGMLADLSEHTIRSYRNDDAVQIPFGLAVAQATKDDGMKLPAASGDVQKLVGITHNTPARNNIGETSGALVGEMVGVVSDGPIWVTVEEAVTPADAPYVRFALGATSGKDQPGSIRKSADTLVAWAGSTAYTVGQRAVNSSKVYECITAGTSASSGGPTTTASDITDGTAHWKYVGAGAAGATAAQCKGARFLTSAAAGGLAQLEFDAISARLA